ncbi:MAG TPA: hypothetical protein VKY73_21100 [Polyangiaceae bacterium]|nr:hypothetical protein [Polyangiaceae bacterium]
MAARLADAANADYGPLDDASANEAGSEGAEAAQEPTSDTEPSEKGAEGKPNGKAKANGKGAPASEAAPEGKNDGESGQSEPAEAKTEGASREEKLTKLRELAQELGWAVEDNAVTPSERAKFRQWRESAFKRLQQERENALLEVTNAKKGLEEERAQLEKLREEAEAGGKRFRDAADALDSGDFDAFAKVLGYDDWNALNSAAITKFADPNFRKLRDMELKLRQEQERREREEKEMAERRAREEKEAKEREEQQRRAQMIAAYKRDLSVQMAESSNPIVRSMADDPMFVEAIFQVQSRYYTGSGTIPPEEALEKEPMDGGEPLLKRLRALYSRLDTGFRATQPPGQPSGGEKREPIPRGDQVPEQSAPAAQTAAKQKTSIPARKASEAAPIPKNVSDAEFMKFAERRMRQAIREEESRHPED